jgi:hypothetical protein
MTQGQIIHNKARVTAPAAPETTAGTEAQTYAERIVEALEVIAASGTSDAREAQRHVERVRFAMDRARELQAMASAEHGVFAPARLDVGIAILEGCVGMSAGFVARAMAVKRPPRPVHDLGAAVDAAVAAVATREEMAA